jgi:peptidoglycan-N-acetylglucosamine deacetylase
MKIAWTPSLGIKASAVLHVGAVAALATPGAWPWLLGGVLANHAVLTAAGLWPRSSLLGQNLRTLSNTARHARQIAITIDDGPNPEVTPAVLDILDVFGAKATFFCIGQTVRAHPSLAREIVRRGHAIENHSDAHRHYFSLMGMGQLRREITAAQNAIADATGILPTYFRAPAGLRSPLLDPVLQSLNLALVSWTRRGYDTVTNNPSKVLQRLQHQIAAADILLLHDGHCAKTAQGLPIILDVLPMLLQTMRKLDLHPVSLRNAAY